MTSDELREERRRAKEARDQLPMLTIGQVVGRNLAQLRQGRGQTQQEAAIKLQQTGLNWTAANIASIESGRRETVDIGALSLLALAYDVPLSSLFRGDDEMQLSAATSIKLDVYRTWLDEQSDTDRVEIYISGRALKLTLDAMDAVVDERVSFQADADLAERLGLRPEDVYEAAEKLWGRNLHQERDRRLAELGEMAAAQRRTRRGHITRQLAKELAPHLPPSSSKGE